MSFPALSPTSRSFSPGNFPVKSFQAQDGSETRYLYGNRRVGMSLKLTYANIPDQQAQGFLAHYHQMFGTYQQFEFTPNTAHHAKDGWAGDPKWIGASEWGSKWRYASEPDVTSVYPGISTVTVELVAATV
jgi:hypothetical protein